MNAVQAIRVAGYRVIGKRSIPVFGAAPQQADAICALGTGASY